ncbi:hypothetical protein Tco_0228460 [Tanacetum coccineum]
MEAGGCCLDVGLSDGSWFENADGSSGKEDESPNHPDSYSGKWNFTISEYNYELNDIASYSLSSKLKDLIRSNSSEDVSSTGYLISDSFSL